MVAHSFVLGDEKMKFSIILTALSIFIMHDISEIKRFKKLYADTGDVKIAKQLKFQKIMLAATCVGAAFCLYGMIFLRRD